MARTRRDSRRTGLWPLSYMGAEPIAPPLLITDNRAPTANDRRNFNVGTLWIDRSTAPAEDVWMLVNLDGNVARWIRFATVGVGIETLTGNIGAAVGADALLNIDVVGAGPYIFTGTPATWTMTLTDDGTIPITHTTDAGNATAVANVLNILGGAHINSAGAGNTVTINLDTDIADTYTTDAGNAIPVAGVLNVLGGNLCGTTGAGNTVTVNVDGTVSASFVTDAGTATPVAGVLNVLGGLNIGTTGAGNTVTVNLDNPGLGVVESDGAGVLSASTGNDGQVLIDATAGTPAWANITSGDATVTITNGANTIDLSAASVASATIVTKFTSSGTWTKNANTKFVEFYVYDGGGGGGSGRRGASTAAGGGGGGSVGNFFHMEAPEYCFGATETVTVGATAAGGATQVVDNTDGNNGTAPNGSGFAGAIGGTGFFPSASLGGLNGNAVSGANGGLWYNLYDVPAIGTVRGGTGEVADGSAVNAIGGGPGWIWQFKYHMPGAGGGGAGADSIVERTGSNGSPITNTDGSILVAGGVGGLESVAIDGTNGANNTAGFGMPSGGLGGGGGGGQSVGAAAGNGGNGGIPGGGGGGGGGSLNGTNSGVGGDGARGEVVVIEYL